MRDVIVVGAGGGGPVVAKELAAQGLDVLVLEAGPHFRDPETEWSRYENDADNPVTGYFRWGPADRERPAWFREQPQASTLFQHAAVGGTTLLYFANSPRAMPGAFVGYDGPDRDAYDTAHPFPFTYDELIPYYEWVEHTLPVQTAAMGTKESVFFEGAERAGLAYNPGKDITRDSYRPQENAILQPAGAAGHTTESAALVFPKARGCTLCGHCYQGCVQPRGAPRNLKAKRSTDCSYVPMALSADRWWPGGRPIELLPNAYATKILFEGDADRAVARGVRWRDTATGDEHEETASVVVLAAGCTEDPRLWLNSGLPNPNDWVGRGYTNHFHDCVIGQFDHYTGHSRGVGSGARADFPGRGMLEHSGLPPALTAPLTQFSLSGIRGFYGDGATGQWDGPSGRLDGRELKELMTGLDRLICLVPVADDDVEPHNRVLQSAFPGDEHGPIPKLVFPPGRRSARTMANREFLARQAARILRAAGARRVYRFDWIPWMLHLQSSMRMGRDAADSVVDETGEARFVERLFIADNAALANSVGGCNPTLTTQAIATRTAEKLVVKYFGGEPWVATDNAVSSIDDRVTQAVLDGCCEL